MHHSQLEYLIAVQNLQRQDRGAKGYEVAEYLNVSPAYAVKLNVYAESQGYIRRDRARTIYRQRKESLNGDLTSSPIY